MANASTTSTKIGLIGAGNIGSFHGETIQRRIPDAELVAVVDPDEEVAGRLARALGARSHHTDAAEMFSDTAVNAVIIAAPARSHADLVVAAAEAGKHVFCEKPMAVTLQEADRAIAAARERRLVLQVGFQRRFARDWQAARELLDAGRIGSPRLLRSLTRDPGFDPASIPPNTIFLETLIHDFDTLNFLNPNGQAAEVHTIADALVEPAWRDRGLLDTAVALVHFDNGAVGVAEACFEAAYGYDVRAEVFGSSGMATLGSLHRTGLVYAGANGLTVDPVRTYLERFHGAYTAELEAFVDVVRTGAPPAVSGEDARAALAIALAAIESVETGGPTTVRGTA